MLKDDVQKGEVKLEFGNVAQIRSLDFEDQEYRRLHPDLAEDEKEESNENLHHFLVRITCLGEGRVRVVASNAVQAERFAREQVEEGEVELSYTDFEYDVEAGG